MHPNINFGGDVNLYNSIYQYLIKHYVARHMGYSMAGGSFAHSLQVFNSTVQRDCLRQQTEMISYSVNIWLNVTSLDKAGCTGGSSLLYLVNLDESQSSAFLC